MLPDQHVTQVFYLAEGPRLLATNPRSVEGTEDWITRCTLQPKSSLLTSPLKATVEDFLNMATNSLVQITSPVSLSLSLNWTTAGARSLKSRRPQRWHAVITARQEAQGLCNAKISKAAGCSFGLLIWALHLRMQRFKIPRTSGQKRPGCVSL